MHDEIVYPNMNPLYNINPNTTGSPITVVPKNHIILAMIILLIRVCFSNSALFICGLFFKVFTKFDI